MSTDELIRVPVLVDGTTSEEFLLAPEIREYGTKNMESYRDGAPLLVLATGFWGRTPDSDYISPALRKSIYGERGRSEWTADHVNFDIETPTGVVVPNGYKRANWIQMADNITQDNGKYIAEGGTVTVVELPPNGWQVPDSEGIMFHPITGSPLATLPEDRRHEAVRQLKDAGFEEGDLSYFYMIENGLRAVLRCYRLGGGPFFVVAHYWPGDGYSNFGSRSCRRLEQDAERLATPVYMLDREGYELLKQLAETNPEASDILRCVRQQE